MSKEEQIKNACELMAVAFEENKIGVDVGVEACETIIVIEANAQELSNEEFKMRCDMLYQKFLMLKKIRREWK